MVGLAGGKDCREHRGNTVGMYRTTERGVNMCTRFKAFYVLDNRFEEVKEYQF